MTFVRIDLRRLLLVCLVGVAPAAATASTPTCPTGTTSPCVIRGPYLQIATPTSIVVRWRTDVATDSEVRWGTSSGSLPSSVSGDLTVAQTDHELAITGLSPATKYYYSAGTTATILSGGTDHVFLTAPPVASQGAIRVWATGDFGTATRPAPFPAQEMAVRDSYKTFTNGYQDYTHVWLMLGDNGYTSGTDSEYQTDIFDPTYAYQTFLRRTAPWPALGNHDAAQATNPAPTIPYFLNFTLPTNGEAGGQPSGTEHYYSFDYANVHFVCLDSQTVANRQPGSPMLTWIANDLSSTSQDWIIAYWHHPPYSHGSHNSDTEIELKEMRKNVVPVLEAHGVDLVLSGHSHGYERSFLIDGHYGDHATWDPSTMQKDGGSGRVADTGAYRKPTIGPAPHEGTVYAVVGSSGEGCTFTGCNHMDYPAMYVSVPSPSSIPPQGGSPLLGSLVLDIKGKRLDARFLRETGAIDDSFTIIKGPIPSFSISDATVTEGDSATKSAVFAVTLDPAADGTVQVDYHTADGTAVAGSDYVPTSGTLIFPAGTKTRTLSVPVVGDTVPETMEAFSVVLQAPSSGSAIARATGQGTILDNDISVFEFSSASYTTTETLTSATITVKRTGGLGTPASVAYSVSDGTATAGDYSTLQNPGTLTFAPGMASRTFTVSIFPDTLDAPNQTAMLRLMNPASPSLLGAQRTAVLTIVDHDVPGTVQFSSANYGAIEGGPPATITVKRVGAKATAVVVNYVATPGTASSPGDFTAVSGTLTFGATGAAALAQTFQVPIGPADGIPEGAKTVLLSLSPGIGGAALGAPNVATLTIQDSDSTIEFGSTAYSVKESMPSAVITVKRSGPLTGVATVGYATSDGTAAANADYKPAAGTLTFGPNVSTRTFVVPILKDALVEGPETVVVTLSPPTGGASLGAANPATLTILDDDVAPALQFTAASYSAAEPAGATPTKASIAVKRTGSLIGTVAVDYTTSGTATNGLDYTLPSPGTSTQTLTFGPGVALRNIPISVLPDTLVEGTETVVLTLSNPQWSEGVATIGSLDLTTLTVLDNEPTVQFVASKYTVSEAATKATIVVRRTGSLVAGATVDYTVTGGTATNGSDYSLPASGTLTFLPRAATALLPITLIPDTADEANETVELTLSSPSPGMALGTPQVTTLTILDNDKAGTVQFSAANYSVDEGGGTATLAVIRTGGTSSGATVDYTVTGGTATNGSDYTLAAGTLTFGLGETTKTIAIPIVDDASVEGNETVLLALSNPGPGLAVGAQAQATLWIVDND